MMRVFFINFLIGLLAATIANAKGHSFTKWLINGSILGPFSLIYVLLIPKKNRPTGGETQITCPHCNRAIAADAKRCPLCEKTIDIIDV